MNIHLSHFSSWNFSTDFFTIISYLEPFLFHLFVCKKHKDFCKTKIISVIDASVVAFSCKDNECVLALRIIVLIHFTEAKKCNC